MSDNSSWPVWLDGEWIAPGAPAISAEDPGFLLGLAVFDTMLCEGGDVFFVEDHLARLNEAAHALGIPLAEAAYIKRGLSEVVAALEGRDAALRITLTPGAPGQGPCTVITCREWVPPPADGVAVLIVEGAKVADGWVEGVKTTSRARNVLLRERALKEGAYEALLGTDEGDLSEGTVSNLFVVVEGELRTPPLERGCLAGILRGKVLEIAVTLGLACRECRVERADLDRADEAFLTSSLARILPITRVVGGRDDLPRGGGPVTRALQAGLRTAEQTHIAARGALPAS